MPLSQQLICLLLVTYIHGETADNVSISTVNHTMIEGFQYELQCDVINVAPVQNLTVRWYKGQTLVYHENFSDTIKTPVNITATLQITPDRDDDGSQYRCEAVLQLGEEGPQPPPTVTSEALNITVHYKPKIHFCNNWSPRIKTSLSLYPSNLYSVVGNPPPNIFWSRGSSSLNDLIFDKFDSGQYNITASNDNGADSCIMNITVEYPPRLNCSKIYQIQEETPFKVPCLVDGFPEPDISLYNNGKLIMLPYIPRWNDSGEYIVMTSNKAGTKVHRFSVDVLYAPRFPDTKQEKFVVVEGGSITLECSSSGHPEPDMWWSFKNTNISTGRRNITLNIQKATSTSAGVYTCSAMNAYGHKEKAYLVDIRDLHKCTFLQLNPQRVVVRYGSSVSVNCSTDVTHNGIGWEASEGGVPTTRDKSLITWRVSNLREWDIKPFCYINYKKYQCEKYLSVTVYKTPDIVSISTVDHTGPVAEGSLLNLQCDVINVAPVQNLTVRWYKGQTLVYHENFSDTIKTPVNITATLQITPDRDDDGSQYRCEAVLQLGAEGPQPPPTVTSEALNITVHYKPKIHFCNNWSPRIKTSLSSYPSNLYSVVGNPPPNIFWSRGSSSLNDLIFDKFDSGQYNITASNDNGADSCIMNITVEYPPKLNCSKIYQIQEETPFKVPCSVDGFPEPDISLYNNGKLIMLPYIPRWNDSGEYIVMTSNKAGTKVHRFSVDVLYAPRFPDTKQEKFVVVEGGSITLECSSSGHPEPDMWWSFKNTNISTGRRNITLNIQKATSTSAGVYTCSAMNAYGHKEKAYLVDIRAKFPIFNLISIIVFVLLLVLILIICLYVWRRKTQGEDMTYNQSKN